MIFWDIIKISWNKKDKWWESFVNAVCMTKRQIIQTVSDSKKEICL